MGDTAMAQVNYFELLAMPATFQIDKKQLQANFKQKAAQFHPDNNQASNAIMMFADLNEAYQTLLSNAKRAFYLLQMQGIATNIDSSMQDFDFLSKQLDFQEELENATKIETLEALQEQLDALIQQYFDDFADNAKIDSAYKLQFLEKLEQRLNQKFQDLEGYSN
jgi:molecular chaperone HscB